MNNKVEQAVWKFSRGVNCAQSVLLTYCNELNLDMNSILKLGNGLDEKLYKSEVCGAVTGAIMVLGLKYGNNTNIDSASEEKVYEMINLFRERFQKMNCSTICKDLIGCNLRQKGMRDYAIQKGVFKDICPKLIKDAIDIIEELKC
ncbi:C_gcaxxg_c_c family protein [Clostridium pasteurianum DSM 525 = ATCC 6013]|uniref:C_gcaxxg_c_c family protein n=1 Tax=Clostridium pasteurianum DSM 525 = ATCC 6013 TaxID=1262449 RepID=A0A0H3JAI4_CLOPA|nr:C-GCAxxG-C-C family protein [Clostridium pasteurianum]AJA48590.1 C_gcaxxg_c_c family protein [Clostridium pasteurianum DSM 525 = ATCC 6013]AJA52578.1 C_gcaxxg_c_c family protein [Clostridium pasteurianum DSM 525 = ATCC 6013]AOZ75821.1 hypothetical protein AQ983_12245 [Clostridium pasteurianum DSM 525 = ATCC 6013]AOZ79617.1 hypothetical protein AQ984_12240 [Clostridium pasteurianum]ELP57932.1 c_gcaxxg_c_c family protein [Clostridium pasteurianum DSM 525 = ATCC 6013]